MPLTLDQRDKLMKMGVRVGGFWRRYEINNESTCFNIKVMK